MSPEGYGLGRSPLGRIDTDHTLHGTPTEWSSQASARGFARLNTLDR